MPIAEVGVKSTRRLVQLGDPLRLVGGVRMKLLRTPLGHRSAVNNLRHDDRGSGPVAEKDTTGFGRSVMLRIPPHRLDDGHREPQGRRCSSRQVPHLPQPGVGGNEYDLQVGGTNDPSALRKASVATSQAAFG